jgi:putative membrane protein
MPLRDFFEPAARGRATQVVRDIEALTSAEVVVTVRKDSGDSGLAHWRAGAIGAALTAATMLLLPQSFSWEAIGLDTALGLLAGAGLVAASDRLRLLLTGAERVRAAVLRAAHAAFYELGVSRTSGRNGLLVYVSGAERAVELVPDLALQGEELSEALQAAQAAARQALGRGDFDGFLAALGSLGPLLAVTHPRGEDDVNELPDEVQ